MGPARCHLPLSSVELSVCRLSSVGLSVCPSVVPRLWPGYLNGLVPTATRKVKQNLMVTKVNTSFIALEHPIHSFQKVLKKSEFYKQHASAIFYVTCTHNRLQPNTKAPRLYLQPPHHNKTYVCQNQHNARLALL